MLTSMVILVAVIGVFVVKLVDIQVVRADELNTEAVERRSSIIATYGERGDIVDAGGALLATSVMRYDIVASPKNAGEFEREVKGSNATITVDAAFAEIAGITGQTTEAVAAVIHDALAADKNSDYVYIAKLQSVEVYRALDDLDIPWLYFEKHPSRSYPNGSVAGNLIGFVGDEGEALAGLEMANDGCLAGVDGEQIVQYSGDRTGLPGGTVTLRQAQPGGTLQLTIDSDLQYFVQQALAEQAVKVGATWGSVVVMNAKTSELVAVADYPSVDPNNIDATAPEYRGSQAFTSPFEPGSTFKALTAASIIDAGAATPSDGLIAPYQITFPNGANVNDSDMHGDDRLTLTGVLIDSSNTGMSQFGEKISDQSRYDYMQKFGLGTQSEVGFPSEASGDLHGDSPDNWDNQTKYATMFGQGLTTTSIQNASIFQTIANGGVRMPVSLVSGCTRADGTVVDKPKTDGTQVISASAASQTSQMLEMVYKDAWLRDKWAIPGYRVAAKTGTAQASDGQGGYSTGYIVSITGFAPADDPQFVVAVSLSDAVNMNSSAAAAPVFQEVLSQALKTYRAVPSGTPAPELPASW